ncbi:MAG: MFS transporter [Ignavibacteriae bacterium]|nr:MFS transporter [Ignavibacteriota bacterium]MCB9208814.1 MFS transporter [Ignavibacteriales bacterium]MCB9218268.1 MFS transporter [Ignavibacteriales bacterium]MCB9260563.1 MFS transporter [Ignavibacteriales bacterium]
MDAQNYNSKKLFLMSCVALIVTAISFALRARLEPIFMSDYGLTATDIGFAFGPAFYGFTISMVLFGSFVDSWGMKKVLTMAFILHFIGITGTIFSSGMWSLFFSTAAIGVGNGAIEAACNPLVASIYPNNKAAMLNRFHVWFPGGIVIGSLVAYFMLDVLNLNWQLYVAMLYIPLVIYGLLFLKETFPQTERVTSGVTTGEMWKSLTKPIFIFMAFCMLLTAVTELATQQRISSLLADANAIPMLVLALTTGLMALGRAFAGPVVHKLSTSGMLLFSAIVSFIGLQMLSYSNGLMVYVAAAVFAVGVCFFWPTMLGFVAEEIPESGALGLSVIGGLGMFSVSIVLPIMGVFMDTGTQGSETLRYMSYFPAILIVLFGFLYSKYGKKKKVQVSV